MKYKNVNQFLFAEIFSCIHSTTPRNFCNTLFIPGDGRSNLLYLVATVLTEANANSL